MAEPPQIRRPVVPPPIPGRVIPPVPTAAPVASAAGDELDDTSSVLRPPDAMSLVGQVLELVAGEAAALLGVRALGERLADLNVRIALATWDALRQPDEALRLLELADDHPLAPRLRAMAAHDDPALLDRLSETATGALAIDLAEAWLWRHGRADRAGALCDRLLTEALEPDLRAHVVELAALAHGAAGDWARVVALRVSALTQDAPLDEVAATAALMLDRTDDAAGALALCWGALEQRASGGAAALGQLRCVDVALDAATRLADLRRTELLERRAALLDALDGGRAEALATRMALASALEARGDRGSAARWAELAEASGADAAGALRRYAYLRAAWSTDDDDLARATKLAAHRRLADAECRAIAASHAWRALELAARADDDARDELARAVVEATGSPVAERWLDLAEIAAASAASAATGAVTSAATSAVTTAAPSTAPSTATSTATIARFEARGGLALRWAAILAERSTPPGAPRPSPRAVALWQRAAAAPTALATTPDHLARLHRGGNDDELSAAYLAWTGVEPDGRCAAALWCARGVVDLSRGDFVEAEDSLHHAAGLGPGDPFCRATLAAVYRSGKRHEPLTAALAELARTLTSREARAAVSREYAELIEHAGDPASARAALEQMIADRPDDVATILALARLCDRDQRWAQAGELRRRAVALAAPADRGALWLEIARGEERRADPEAALAALDRAALAGHPDAPREQARIHHAAGRLERALEIVRAELAGDPPLARRMEVQKHVARLLTELGREPAAVVAAYLDVLDIEPDQTEALIGIERPARALGLWDELARAFRGAPQTARNLEVLAEALTHIAEWSELAEVRRRQLESATTNVDKAQRAGELAHLHEHQLGDLDAAIRMLTVAQQLLPDAGRHQDLVRLLRGASRWGELTLALERALPTVPADDVARQIEILLELGELRATRMNRASDAALAYEAVLERVPNEPTATAALEPLYEKLGNDRGLARMLERRADTETGAARAALLARVAGIRADRGDVDGAITAFAAAFVADPANRDVFTAMERVCYKAERWTAAMQLYDTAIEQIESGTSRAYRLGDLYARRGNVQLNFLGQEGAAIASYQKVVEVDSQPAAAVKILEELCAKRDDWQPLITAYERRAETQRDPQRKSEALRAAAALIKDHAPDPGESVRINRKLLDADPADDAAAVELEQFYEAAQDRSGLIEILKLRLTHADDQAASVELLKRIARASEDGARDVVTATEHYQKMLALQPENRDALEALGRIYESTEQWAELVEVTRKQIKVTTDRNTKALLFFRCGSVMEAKFGRAQDAIRYYDAAIKTSASCLPAIHGLRDLYRRQEDWPRVIETLELEVKLWQDDKERAGVFAQIGRVYAAQLDDPERAMQFYDSALAVDPDCLPANQAVFEHFFHQGAWAKAQPIATALAQKAMRDGDPSTRSDFYRKRGVVARMTGDPRAAAESFVVALEIKPGNTEALDDLGALARERPDVWEFDATYRELEKVYKRRDDAAALLARVHVGRAALRVREGDLDHAAELYRQGLELAPGDLTVLSAHVDFHADMRRWPEAIAALEKFVASEGASPADRIAALMRRAAIHADGELDPTRAIAVLGEVLVADPTNQDAYYEVAQQYFLAGRYPEARAAIDRVIELASAPGQPLSASALARYYYYRGRILDASGDARAAAPQYRRAIEYDPGYAPPALVLARRAAEAGDQRQAETLLIDTAHAAMAKGGPRAAVPLQRGLARILLGSGDRPAAIEAYRGILNVEPDSASDRVALAEIYAVDDPPRAISELRKVLDRDIHNAPAYRLLASFYSRTGDTERANRVLTALDQLGFAEDADRATMQRLLATRLGTPLRSPLGDDARRRLLVTHAAREPLGEVFDALAPELSALVATPSLGDALQPAISAGEPRLVAIAGELAALYQTEAEIFVGDKVPGLLAVTAFPRRLLVLDRALLAESELVLRFVLGYALEAIRGGYAALLQLGARQRRELGHLLRALFTPDPEPTGPAAELLASVGPRAQQVIARHVGVRDVDPGAWIDGMLACAKRAGLVACDDFPSAIWAVALMAGEKLTTHHATVALGSVLGGPDLVRFFLSDAYQAVRDLITM